MIWKRMVKGWKEGDVIVTVGTGSLSPSEEQEFGLVSDHNYSIFRISWCISTDSEIRDDPGRRFLQVRNPWSKGGTPKSSFSTSDLLSALHPTTDSDPSIPDDSSRGLFWIDYAALTRSFKTLYLNWNPALFQYCSRKHFTFTPNGSDFDIATNGQFTITVDGTGEVWIMVERHYLGKSEGWEGYIGI